MREAGAPITRKLLLRFGQECAHPTGGSHGLTTDAPAQRFKGAKLKAAPDRSKGAARGIIKGGARKPRVPLPHPLQTLTSHPRSCYEGIPCFGPRIGTLGHWRADQRLHRGAV